MNLMCGPASGRVPVLLLSPDPGGPGNGGGEGLHVPRRNVDQEEPDLSVSDGLQVLADDPDVPTVPVDGRVYLGPEVADELVKGPLAYLPIEDRIVQKDIRGDPRRRHRGHQCIVASGPGSSTLALSRMTRS